MTLLRVPRRTETPERRLVTVMFTDVVSSTERAAELGDRGWKQLLSAHHAAMRRLLKRYGGREIDTAGDGFFMTFDQPSRAIDCAIDMIGTIAAIGLHIRAGIHMGEVEIMGSKVAGMTVHIGARLMSLAGADEIVVSSTVRDLLTGSEMAFIDRGFQQLKGVDSQWHVYAIDRQPILREELLLPEPGAAPRSRRFLIGGAIVLLAIGSLAGFLLSRDGGTELAPAPNTVALVGLDGVSDVVPVGTGPQSLAVDGSTLWVGNSLDQTVQRVDLDSLQAEPAGGVPLSPSSVVVGGGFVWVGSDLGEPSLVRIDPTQPNSAEAVDVGVAVSGLAYGQDSLWVTSRNDGLLLRVDPATGAVDRFEMPPASGPIGVAVSDDAVWVALNDAGAMVSVDPDSGSVSDPIPISVGAPGQVAWGAGYVWATIGAGDAVVRIDPRTSSVFTIEHAGDGPAGIAANQDDVWVASSLDGRVIRIDPATGDVTDRVEVGRDVSPQAVVFADDGTWVSLMAP